MFKYELGKFVTDASTGFAGIINARWERISGNIQYSIKPMVGDDGKMTDSFWVDDDYLVIDEEKSIKSKYGNPFFKFSNGDKVKITTCDKFTGYIVGRSQCLNGCLQYYIQHDKLIGGETKSEWFSEPELKLVKGGAADITPVRTGGFSAKSPY